MAISTTRAESRIARALKVPIEGPHAADKYCSTSVERAAFGMTAGRNYEPDRWLDGRRHRVDRRAEFDILHCPGHSPGSVVFFNKELRSPMSATCCSRLGRAHRPARRQPCHTDQVDHDKLLPLGDDVGFICGHGAGSSIGQERMTNPFITGAM